MTESQRKVLFWLLLVLALLGMVAAGLMVAWLSPEACSTGTEGGITWDDLED